MNSLALSAIDIETYPLMQLFLQQIEAAVKHVGLLRKGLKVAFNQNHEYRM